jgi:hypothetical protein
MKSTRYSCQILTKFKFSLSFSKDTQISKFVKILRVGAELFHVDGRTGMMLIVAFRSFAKVPKNTNHDKYMYKYKYMFRHRGVIIKEYVVFC